jgi:hypothetical protein
MSKLPLSEMTKLLRSEMTKLELKWLRRADEHIKRMPAVDNDHNDTCQDYESGYRWLHECGSERRDINIKRMPAVTNHHSDTCLDYESGYR